MTSVQVVFFVTIVATFVAAAIGRSHARRVSQGGLANQKLNKWMIGLSAGATANSGFIVTGAVGLGYIYGYQWLFLPIAWLLGDLVFWSIFPDRLNRAGRESDATTLSELLAHGISGNAAKTASVLATVLIVLCLGGYTSAQWLAGQKFLSGAFDVSGLVALAGFALLIVAYSTIGGFRGSVYADSVQALVRIAGTTLALGAVFWFAFLDWDSFKENISLAGPGFASWLPGASVFGALGFFVGFAFAGLGFGLGQPQLVSRYLAGSSPAETKAAWWVYIGFVHLTWISMTLFGVVLRGVMPGLDDPETGLSAFFQSNMGALATGVIVADIFATIAATSNSLLVAMAQAVAHAAVPVTSDQKRRLPVGATVAALGLLTMASSLALASHATVFGIALSSVSLMGAGLAPAVLVKVLAWRRSGMSLLLSMIAGLVSAVLWKFSGYAAIVNEAAIGIITGVVTNWLVVILTQSAALSPQTGSESIRIR